jgi:hypothetical protein
MTVDVINIFRGGCENGARCGRREECEYPTSQIFVFASSSLEGRRGVEERLGGRYTRCTEERIGVGGAAYIEGDRGGPD